jgi:hypothetical protein
MLIGWRSAAHEFDVLLLILTIWAFLTGLSTVPADDFCRTGSKVDRLPRTTAGFTTGTFDGCGLRDHWPAHSAP